MRKIVIAIDGYSSCGKSTTAKAVAAELGYAYIDTGAMYRAVTLYLLENNIRFDDLPRLATLLEKAGCRDFDILAHCRESALHVPGCHLLDFLIGKA